MAADVFRTSTPHEVTEWIRARTRADSEHLISLAWYSAAMQRTKQLPKLAKLLAEASGDPEAQQAYQHEQALRMREHLREVGAWLKGREAAAVEP